MMLNSANPWTHGFCPPFLGGQVPQTADSISLTRFPITAKVVWGDDTEPLPLEMADALPPAQYPYELAGTRAFGKKLALHAALPPNTFAQHASLKMAEYSGFALLGATAFLTAGWEALMALPPSYLVGMATGLTYGAYFGICAAGVVVCSIVGLRDIEKKWREEREFRAWKASSTLGEF